jgi:hypothetical protein
MSDHHVKASEMDESEEVFNMLFPARDEPAEVVHPGEGSFHFPAPAIAPQLTPALSPLSAPMPIGCNPVDSILGGKLLVEWIRVVCFVADWPGGKLVEEACGENVFHKLGLGRQSAFDRYGERKTVSGGDSDDLRARTATGGADSEAPFLAFAKVASTNASPSLPLRTHCWKRLWQVWNGGYFSGSSRHCAPVPSTHNTPFSTARV